MASKLYSIITILSLSSLSFLSLCSARCAFPTRSRTKGFFVFGSSLVDNGNNNFFDNRARVDYLPYGVDFPGGPTGRFTNGKNLVDLLGQRLRLPNFMIPSFKDPSTRGSKVVNGVNHASGSSGILDETGLISGNVTSLSQQVRDFEDVTLPELKAQLGCESTDSLRNYIFVIGVGGNDILFNYFLRQRFLTIDAQTFTANLTATLSERLKKLYSLGARKFVLTAVYPLGDSPTVVLNNPNCTPPCGLAINTVCEIYNANLKSMLKQFRLQMPGSYFSVIDTYNILKEILLFPSFRGFTNTTNGCCEVLARSQGGNGVLCVRGGQICPDRSKYVYFDALHATEDVNILLANYAYFSHNMFKVYPMNVQQLSQIRV